MLLFQMTTECTNIFHSKALKNLPKFEFFDRKYTIWQPWTFLKALPFFSKLFRLSSTQFYRTIGCKNIERSHKAGLFEIPPRQQTEWSLPMVFSPAKNELHPSFYQRLQPASQ
jgi:hypothetical protein